MLRTMAFVLSDWRFTLCSRIFLFYDGGQHFGRKPGSSLVKPTFQGFIVLVRVVGEGGCCGWGHTSCSESDGFTKMTMWRSGCLSECDTVPRVTSMSSRVLLTVKF